MQSDRGAQLERTLFFVEDWAEVDGAAAFLFLLQLFAATRALARVTAAEEADGTSEVVLLTALPGKRFGHGCMSPPTHTAHGLPWQRRRYAGSTPCGRGLLQAELVES